MNHSIFAASALALVAAAGVAMAQAPAAAPPAGLPQPPAQPMVVKTVKPGVYMILNNGGNSTVVVGTSGVILVDTKYPGQAVYDELMARIHDVTALPVKEAIVTHHHSDHSGGTAALEAAKVPVVANVGEAEALKTYKPAGDPPPVIPAPTKTYTDSLTINVGGVRAEVHHWAGAHTGGDSVVYFPAQKIVAAGDEVAAGTPNIDSAFGGSLNGYLTSLAQIAKLDFDYVIPGHGADPITKADFLVYQQKWITFAARGRAMVRAGTPKEKLMASIKTDDLGWKTDSGVWVNPARVDALYEELSK